jgi:hypothetical protein
MQRMLNFARRQIGKPFSNAGMARSLILPRQSDGSSWCAAREGAAPRARRIVLRLQLRLPRRRFCAELVAAILKEGGLMCAAARTPCVEPRSLRPPGRSRDSNPGAATPYSLYKLYSKQAAATANPYTLRAVGGLTFDSMVSPQARAAPRPSASSSGAPFAALCSHPALVAHPRAGQTADSLPPGFKVLSARGQGMGTPGITLSLNSLSSAPR